MLYPEFEKSGELFGINLPESIYFNENATRSREIIYYIPDMTETGHNEQKKLFSYFISNTTRYKVVMVEFDKELINTYSVIDRRNILSNSFPRIKYTEYLYRQIAMMILLHIKTGIANSDMAYQMKNIVTFIGDGIGAAISMYIVKIIEMNRLKISTRMILRNPVQPNIKYIDCNRVTIVYNVDCLESNIKDPCKSKKFEQMCDSFSNPPAGRLFVRNEEYAGYIQMVEDALGADVEINILPLTRALTPTFVAELAPPQIFDGGEFKFTLVEEPLLLEAPYRYTRV